MSELIVLGDDIYAIGGSTARDDLQGGPLPQEFTPPTVPADTVAKLLPNGQLDLGFGGGDGLAPLSSFPQLAGYTDLEQAPGGDLLYVGRLNAFSADPAFVVTRLDSDLAVDPTFTPISVPLNLDFGSIASGFDYGIDFDVDSAGNVVVAQFTTGSNGGFAEIQKYNQSGLATGSGVVQSADLDDVASNGLREIGVLDSGGLLLGYARSFMTSPTQSGGSAPAVAEVNASYDVTTITTTPDPSIGTNNRYGGLFSHPDGRYIATLIDFEGSTDLLTSAGVSFPFVGNDQNDGITVGVHDVVFPQAGGAVILTTGARSSGALPLVDGVSGGRVSQIHASANELTADAFFEMSRTFVGLDNGPGPGELSLGYANALTLAPDGKPLVGGTLASFTTQTAGVATDPDTFDTPAAVWKYTVGSVTTPDAFEEVSGVVTIEAAEFSDVASGVGGTWVEQSRGGAINGRIVTVPGSGTNTGNNLSGPRLDYDINFASSGTYYVWVRMTGDGGANDSIHVGLNGNAATLGGFGLSSGDDNVLRWTNGQTSLNRRITVNVPAAGVQTLNVWMREDGVQVDDIRVAKSISYDPRTVAPPTNVAPVIASLTATPNPIVVGDDVTLTATGVQDPDGTVASVTFGYVDGTFGDQVIFVDTSGANGWSFTDNTFDIGGGRTYFAFATDNAGLVGNRVEVRLDTTPAPTGVFQEVGGVVTIEASDATRRTAGSGRSWVDASRADAINGEFVTVPGTGVNAGNTLSGPKLDYDINFASSGTYYVWVRMTGPDVGSDSIHVGLNGQASTLGSFGLSTNPTDTFAWTNGQSSLGRRVTITVPAAGVQTLNVWMREDGVKVDDIRVAKSINYDPRVGQPPVNQAPTIGSLTDSPDPCPIDGQILLTANNVNDSDGTVPRVRFYREVLGGNDVLLFTDNNPSNGFAGFVSIAGLVPGATYSYYAVAEDNDGALSTRATTTNTIATPATGGAFEEVSGVVTIEAAEFSDVASGVGGTWVEQSRGGAINGRIVTVPGSGTNTGNNLSGPRLDYDINFASSGTYYVWVRMTGDGGANDSIHVGLNGNAATLGGFGLSSGDDNVLALDQRPDLAEPADHGQRAGGGRSDAQRLDA